MSPFADFRSAAATVAPRAAVVFGSGLAGAADAHFTPSATIPYAEVPGLVPPTVAGHGGRLAVGLWAGVPAVVCFGRVHFYEGHPWDRVTAIVRLIADFGVTTLVLTNAAGGIRDDLNPGDLMPIGGHLKWLGSEGWRGLADEPRPPRSGFSGEGEAPAEPPLASRDREGAASVSGSEAAPWRSRLARVESAPWRSRLVEILTAVTGKPAGIYAALTGPCYETPAEIRALRAIGADAVGMSTAVEAEAAAVLGLTVAGVSCVTNKAAGLAAGTLNHHEVEVVAKQAVGRLGHALTAVLTA